MLRIKQQQSGAHAAQTVFTQNGREILNARLLPGKITRLLPDDSELFPWWISGFSRWSQKL